MIQAAWAGWQLEGGQEFKAHADNDSRQQAAAHHEGGERLLHGLL
jgi:hypothetical protein